MPPYPSSSDILGLLQRAPRLQELTILGNAQLVELQVPAQPARTLRALDVSGCRTLRHISWMLPEGAPGRLRELRAVGCVQLQARRGALWKGGTQVRCRPAQSFTKSKQPVDGGCGSW